MEAESRHLSRQFAQALAGLTCIEAYREGVMRAGCYLWHAGTMVRALPFIEHGSAHAVIRPGDGSTQVVPVTFEAGELAALSRLFSNGPVPFDLIVVEAGTCRWIPIEVVEKLVKESPPLLLLATTLLAARLRQAQDRERIWLERGVQERVRATLSRIAAEGPSTKLPCRLSATHEQLAMRCGISRAKLSHELKALEVAGAVRLQRGTIEIVDTRLLLR